MENSISPSNQCRSDDLALKIGGPMETPKKCYSYTPQYLIAIGHFVTFSSEIDGTQLARELFLTYVRTKMFYQQRIRDEDGSKAVHIPQKEIRDRFFRNPWFNVGHQLKLLVELGELEITTSRSKKGYKMYDYRALRPGNIELRMLQTRSSQLDEVTMTMRSFLLDVSLPDGALSTEYFDAYLKHKEELLDLFFIVDKFSGRVHTPISNFHRTHRPNILLKNSPTSSLDVATMQPLLLSKILKEQIGGNVYSDWIDSGEDIYVMLQKKAKLPTRDDAKQKFFEILFSRKNKQLAKLFGNDTWIEWINEYKSRPEPLNPHTIEKEYSNLAWLLQTTEVKLMRQVWTLLLDAGIPFLSVHDEIIIRKQDQEPAAILFEQVLKNEFDYYKLNLNKYSSCPPTLNPI